MNTWLLAIIPVGLLAYCIYRWVTYGFSWFALGGIVASVAALGAIYYFPSSSDISTSPLEAAATALPTPIQEGARRVLRALRGSK
jgi:hypothetical protein